MGRQETPIREGCEQEVLAGWLRVIRQRARLTYTELAETTGHAPRTLRNAALGESLPTLKLVLDFARGCGVEDAEATRRWHQALRRCDQGRGPHRLLRPEYVANFADLRAAMIEIRALAGNPSLRCLAKAAGAGNLPRSTLSGVLRGTAPLRLELLVAFLRACGIREREIDAWKQAWRSAQARTVSAREHAKAREESVVDLAQRYRTGWQRIPAQPQPRDGHAHSSRFDDDCPLCRAGRHKDLRRDERYRQVVDDAWTSMERHMRLDIAQLWPASAVDIRVEVKRHA